MIYRLLVMSLTEVTPTQMMQVLSVKEEQVNALGDGNADAGYESEPQEYIF